MPGEQPPAASRARLERLAVSLSIALALAAVARTPAAAAETGPQSSEALVAAAPESVLTGASVSPRGALLRSLLLPGWGQAATGHPYKAAVFAGAAAGLIGWAVEGQSDLNRVSDRLAALRADSPDAGAIAALRQREQDLAARRNSRILWVVLAAGGAALDAFVDAHLAGFDAGSDEFEVVAQPGRIQLVLSRLW